MCAQCCFGRASKMIFGPRFVVTDPRAGVSSKINLRLILVSGKTKEFLFSPSDSAGEIAQTVFDNWPEGNTGNRPEDWAEEAVARAEILRLIYQGRFLHSNVTLGALGLPFGKTTVMHLVPRENLPEPNSQANNSVLRFGPQPFAEHCSQDYNIDYQAPRQSLLERRTRSVRAVEICPNLSHGLYLVLCFRSTPEEQGRGQQLLFCVVQYIVMLAIVLTNLAPVPAQD
uniref:Ubiquitin-like domain-containing protein n=1 Tax=Timema cristinae TaxID=61476 RepID=A0A7R9CLP1_TIMCR|nr:unnamed protein product [Timema cristinae]